LQCNQIVDIKPLTELEFLEKLYLELNKISDITCLARCKNLKTLTIDGNPITSIEVLFQLEKLSFLCTDKRDFFEPLSSIFEDKTTLKVCTRYFAERKEYECYAFKR